MSNEIELKACPACGSANVRLSLNHNHPTYSYQVICANIECCLSGPYGIDEQVATARWQQMPRTQQQPAQAAAVAGHPDTAICSHCGYDPSKWVTFGHITVDIENETETFTRIDALTPAQGGDTQRLDGDFGLTSEYAANLRNAGHILIGVHRKNGGEYPLEQCPRCQAVRYVDYACSTCGRVDLNNKFIELRKRISATIHGLQNLDIMEAPEPAMPKGGRDDG